MHCSESAKIVKGFKISIKKLGDFKEKIKFYSNIFDAENIREIKENRLVEEVHKLSFQSEGQIF